MEQEKADLRLNLCVAELLQMRPWRGTVRSSLRVNTSLGAGSCIDSYELHCTAITSQSSDSCAKS